MDKPEGPTSHDAVAWVRRALRTRAVGHTGTLDPFASGLLVVMVGRATRLARFVEQQPKRYLAEARLGIRTSTDDRTGEVLATRPVPALAAGTVIGTLREFLGPGRQRPPAYSAKKVQGERSYALARRGTPVELAEVEIVVHAVELVGLEQDCLRFRATVSPGTYLRGLARDLGERLGTGAHLTALRREAIGPVEVSRAVPLDAVSPEALRPPLEVLGHLPRLEVGDAECGELGFGRSIPAEGPDRGEVVAVHAGRVIAVGRVTGGRFHPEVVLEGRN